MIRSKVEVDFVLWFGKEIDLEFEELLDSLLTSDTGQEQDVLAKRCFNRDRSVRLCIGCHAVYFKNRCN
jgi:hypothetical protein